MSGPGWLDGAVRVEGSGGDLVGGPPRWVWHTYEADPARLSALAGARALRAAGNDVHFCFNPLTGEIVQMLPADVSGRALRNLPGGVQTNRFGDACLQVEVIGFAARPFTGLLTAAGRAGLGRLVAFARAHGIPDVWPAGPPPAYPRGSSPRSVSVWTESAGHYGHSQVPENDHGDPGAIDVATLWACAGEVTAPPATTTEGGDMDLYRDKSGRVWDIGASGRRHVGHPDTVKAYEARGGRVGSITEAGLASVPLVPGWLLAATPPVVDPAVVARAVVALLPAGQVDVPELAQAIVDRLPVLSGAPTAAEVAAATVNLLAARVRD